MALGARVFKFKFKILSCGDPQPEAADGSAVMHAEKRKAKAVRQSAGARKGPKGAAEILTKEFLEEKMHDHTQKVSWSDLAAGERAVQTPSINTVWQSAGAKKGFKGAAEILTKEFQEEKMHRHTQKVS